MRISTNYSTGNNSYSNYNHQKSNKPCFQANLVPALKETLIMEAKRAGKLGKLNEQFKNIANWGSPKSFINTSYDLKRGKTLLALENYHLSKNYGGSLVGKKDSSLLDQFLSLTEKKVMDAEKNIVDSVALNKKEATFAIFNNPEYVQKLTGEANPSIKKLSSAIHQLSEDELIEYRFGLKDKNYNIEDDFLINSFVGVEKNN